MKKKEKKYKFMIVFEKGKRNYSVYSPDLPGCASTGKTLEQTRELMRQGIKLHVKGMIEDGDPIPDEWSGSEIASVEFIEVEI